MVSLITFVDGIFRVIVSGKFFIGDFNKELINFSNIFLFLVLETFFIIIFFNLSKFFLGNFLRCFNKNRVVSFFNLSFNNLICLSCFKSTFFFFTFFFIYILY